MLIYVYTLIRYVWNENYIDFPKTAARSFVAQLLPPQTSPFVDTIWANRVTYHVAIYHAAASTTLTCFREQTPPSSHPLCTPNEKSARYASTFRLH